MKKGDGCETLASSQLESLARPAAYPHDPTARAGVEWVQTHISHVFLTQEYVYKLRKPVNLGFVNFSTRAERNADCLREVGLNRRLAPDVYRGVAPIETHGPRARIGPVGETLAPGEPEHCVVMRRLPDGRDSLSLLTAGQLSQAQLDRVANRMARFHAEHGLGRPAPFTPREWLRRITAPVRANLELLRERSGSLAVRAPWVRLAERGDAFVREHEARFEARRAAGRAVEGHGDLHLQHVWFERDGDPPLLIDCIEFREDLRRIDAAADIAFLAMDLRYRDRADLAERLLGVYARERDDFDLYGVVDYYVSYRAAVRAKVAFLTAGESEVPAAQREAAQESARRHLDLAVRALHPRTAGGLVVLSGIVGTGKTTAAALLAGELGGVVIASDRVRKHLAGLGAKPRRGSGTERDLYTPERTEAVYAGLLERAEPVVRSGRFAILDATFSLAHQREAARRWASRHAAPFRLVETRCSEPNTLRRLAQRQLQGRDASDAGPAFYPVSAARFETVEEIPAEEHRVVFTDRNGWRENLLSLAHELRRVASPGDGAALPGGSASRTNPGET